MHRLLHGKTPAVVVLALALAGCAPPPGSFGGPGGMPPPEVKVSLPVVRDDIIDYEDFPGRTDAVSSVDVRARVTGYYLETVKLREGREVKKDEVLAEIDPRPYQAELNRAEANLVQAQAHRDRLEADFKRAATLFSRGSISREDYDKFGGDRAEAAAAVGVAQAQREAAELNLKFTKVVAPLSGLISRRYVDPGNLIKADDTILTNIVSLDPIYAYFDVDERTVLRVQRLVHEGKIEWSPEKGLPVWMGLASETGFPHEGVINFADNRVDADTGTWRLRATFANPQRGPLRLLTPGLFVRMHLPIGTPYRALLVSEQALATNQGQKSVFVVKDDNTVEERRVRAGRLQNDGLRVIEDGVKAGEKVVVSGLQRVRAKMTVTPTPIPMPTMPASPAAQEKAPPKPAAKEAKKEPAPKK
jgi:RND family efflux transporter MFP subunit